MAITINTSGIDTGKRIDGNRTSASSITAKDSATNDTTNVVDEETLATANEDVVETMIPTTKGADVKAQDMIQEGVAPEVCPFSKTTASYILTLSTDPYPTAPQQPIRRPDARGALPHHPSHLRGSPQGHEHAHSRENPPSVAQFYDDPRPSPPRGRVGQGRPGAPGRAPGAGYHRPPTAETDISEPSRQARYSGLRQGAGGMQDLRPPRRDPRGMGEWQGGQGGGDGRGNGGMGYAGGGVGYAGGEQGYPVGPLDEADD